MSFWGTPASSLNEGDDMSEMSHVLAHTTRSNPLKRVARKLAPGNKRHVTLSNGVRLGRRGPRFKQIPIVVAKENAQLLSTAITHGVLEIYTPERKLMSAEEVLALVTGKAPAPVKVPVAEAAPPPPPPPPVPEEPMADFGSADGEDDVKTDPGVRKPKTKPKGKSRKGKE